MIDIQREGNRAIIDVREIILKGSHPRGEILEFVKNAPPGTIVEIHMPHRGQPLITGLEGLGLKVIVNELEPGHVRIMTVKLS